MSDNHNRLQDQALTAWQKGAHAFQAAMRMAETRQGISLLWEATTALAQASTLYSQAGEQEYAGITAVFAMQAFDWHFDRLDAWLDTEGNRSGNGYLEVLPEGQVRWQEDPST